MGTHGQPLHKADSVQALSSDEAHRVSVLLRQEPVFGVCPPESLARLLGRVTLRRISKGEHLQELGMDASEAFLVLDGFFQYEGSGGRIVEAGSGLFGQESVLDMDAYATTVTASQDAEVAVFPKDAFRDIVWGSDNLRRLVFASFSDRFYHKSGRQAEAPGDETVAHPYGPAFQRVLDGCRAKSEGNHSDTQQMVGWMLTIVVPVLTYLFLADLPGLPSEQALYMAVITVTAVVMWIFRLIPDFVPALLGVLGAILFGLAPPEVALSGFASDSFFMALGIFGLSSVLTNSGFSYRVLLWLLRIGPANKSWYNVSLFSTGLLLTPVVPSSNGRIAIVTPFLNDLVSAFDSRSVAKEGPRLAASVLAGTSLMTAIFLSSKSINFVVFGFLPFQEQSQFNWFYWFFAASVTGLILLLVFFVGLALFFLNDSRPSIPRTTVRQQAGLLGSMKSGEWAGMLALLLLVAAFLTVSAHRIAIPWISLSLIFGLLLFDFIKKKNFRQDIDWAFLVFLGGLIGIISAFRHLHMDTWLTNELGWLAAFMKDDFNLFVAILAGSIFLVRLALPINATVVIFATLLIPTAINIGVNPWLIGFLVLLFSESYIWPYQASYYVQFQGIASQKVQHSTGRIAAFNMYLALAKLLAAYASIPFWRDLGIL